MGKGAAAPGSSTAAQLREERAKLRRAARKKLEAAIEDLRRAEAQASAMIRSAQDNVDLCHNELKDLDETLRGRKREIVFTAQEGI